MSEATESAMWPPRLRLVDGLADDAPVSPRQESEWEVLADLARDLERALARLPARSVYRPLLEGWKAVLGRASEGPREAGTDREER